MKNNLWKSWVKKIFGYMIVFCLVMLAFSLYFVISTSGYVPGIVLLGTLFISGMTLVLYVRESALELEVNIDLVHRGYKVLMKNISTINVNDVYVNFFGIFVGGLHYSSLSCDEYKVLCVPYGENLDYYVYTFENKPFSYLAVVDKRVKPYNGGVQVFLKTLN